ncbi:hypothetical protein GLYMA_07G255450v4 [Glycine max]|nr:hypothetical protein GLYMA_07G255450v4 [Glycine max]KAH1088601.1 hypothetical protein GYH30_019575 [Glycine max]
MSMDRISGIEESKVRAFCRSKCEIARCGSEMRESHDLHSLKTESRLHRQPQHMRYEMLTLRSGCIICSFLSEFKFHIYSGQNRTLCVPASFSILFSNNSALIIFFFGFSV